MIEKILLLSFILILGVFSKNQAIILSSIFLILVLVFNLDSSILPFLKKYGLKIGITIFTIYAFVPLANGDIQLKDIYEAIFNYRAWIAISAGLLVTQFAKHGLNFMVETPELTTFIVIGIIIGVVALGGVTTGPLVGSGIAVLFFYIFDLVTKVFH